MVFGLLGIFIVVHYLSHLQARLGDFLSIVVGLGLIGVGVIGLVLYLNQRRRK
jgi:hypothetical protein